MVKCPLSIASIVASSIVIITLCIGGAVSAWDLQYDNFSSTSGLNLLNSATTVSNSATGYTRWLRLCVDGTTTGASAQTWTTNKFTTSLGFVVEFQFKVVNSTGMTADGFTFAVQNSSNTATGWSYGPDESAVCLRFDTFQNSGEPSNNFMAIHGTGAGDLVMLDLGPLGLTIADSNLHTIRIEYGNCLMNVYFDGVNRIYKYPIDLATYGAYDLDGKSYLGFTAGTGGAAETNYIATWKFLSGFQMPVETPIFMPDGGTYALPKNVKMTCNTAGAEIHYTTDGSTPSASSTLYTAPVYMSNGTLKAIAVAAGYAASQIKTATYTLAGSVIPLSDTKTTSNTTRVAFNGIVTAAYADGLVFVEDENRTCGIAVSGNIDSITSGMRVGVEGVMATSAYGERYVIPAAIDSSGTGSIQPFGMSIRNIGGGARGLQEGISGAAGLNNIGMLASTWGSFSYSPSGSTITDDSKSCAIEIPWRTGIVCDPSATFAKVTGVVRCSRPSAGAALTRVIRPRNARELIMFPDQEWDILYGPDFTGDPSSIAFSGSAGYTTDLTMDDTRRIRLTPPALGSLGQAFNKSKVSTALGFTTQFVFQMSQPTGGGFADAFSFIMHNSPDGASAVASPWGTSTNSVAVIFDTYKNPGDPSANFVQVQTSGSSGYVSTVVDLTNLGINLKDEYAHLAEITCRPDEGWISLKIDGVFVMRDVPVDFAEAGAIDSSGTSWVGFSGATGSSGQASDIISCKLALNDTANPKYSVTDLSSTSVWTEDAFDISLTGMVIGQTYSGSPFTIQGWLRDSGYDFPIESLGGGITSPYAMDDDGRAAGESTDADSLMSAFLWQGATESLGSLGVDTTSTAWGINNTGSMVGSSATIDGSQRGFLEVYGSPMQMLSTLGGFNSTAFDVNESGTIAGSAENANGDNLACTWDATGVISNLAVLPNGSTSAALSINDDGKIVGYYDLVTGGRHATLWMSPAVTDLGTLGGLCSEAYDINNNSIVVGRAQRTDGVWVACVWQNGIPVDLNWRLPVGSDWLLECAYAINDSGMIVGTGTRKSSGKQHAFVLSP